MKVSDITESVKAKGENTTLVEFHFSGITPLYSREILATYLLMEWPLTGTDQEFLRCYALLLQHGKVFAAEVFFMRQTQAEELVGEYLGTTKVFAIELPGGIYKPEDDDQISELIWQEVAGHARC